MFFWTNSARRSALIDQMEENAELPQLLRELNATADARQQLALIVDFNVRLFERGADVLETLRSAGSVEPDLAATYKDGDTRRRRAQSRLVKGWAAGSALRAGLGEQDAADILWALTSPEVYRLFVHANRWGSERFGDWLRELLTRLLIG